MTKREGAKYWTRNDRKRGRYVRKYNKVFNKALNDQIANFLEYLKLATDPQAVLSAVTTLVRRDDLKAAFVDLYQEVGVDFATGSYNQIKREVDSTKEMTLEDFQYIWTAQMLEYVDTEAATYITSIIGSSQVAAKRIIQRIIAESLDEGLSIFETMEQLNKRVPIEWRNVSKWRSELIARTEVLTASNYGADTGGQSIADELGLQLKRVWIARIDSRTRTIPPDAADHVVMNGQTVDRDKPFNVQGIKMMRPGDPNGGAKNRCNCRCTVAFVRDDGQPMFSEM